MILAVVRIEDTEFSTRVVLKTNTRGADGGISLEPNTFSGAETQNLH